jgi:Predicted transcriptional regulators
MISREEGEEQIINYLKEHGEACITDIAKGINRTSSYVRMRLSKMEGAGEVTFRVEPPRKFYRLNNHSQKV